MKGTSVALAALLFAYSCSAALGAEVSYSTNWGPLAVPLPATTFQLPKFDPALGTLQKVTLSLDATTDSGYIAWDNEAPVESDITLGIGAEVTAAGPDALAVVAIPLQTGSGHVDADNDGAADFLGTDAFSVNGGSGTDDDMAMLTSGFGGYIAAFSGQMFDVDISTGTETYLSTSGGFGPIDPQPGQAYGTIAVKYEYSVPEPTSAVLMGIALFGLAGLSRRRG